MTIGELRGDKDYSDSSSVITGFFISKGYYSAH